MSTLDRFFDDIRKVQEEEDIDDNFDDSKSNNIFSAPDFLIKKNKKNSKTRTIKRKKTTVNK